MPIRRRHEPLDLAAQVAPLLAAALGSREPILFGLGAGRLGFLGRANERAGAPLGRGVLGARGERPQRGRVGDALERRQRDVLVIRLERRRDELLRIRQSGQRLETNGRVLGAPGNRADGPGVVAQRLERTPRDRVAARGFRDEHELLLRLRRRQAHEAVDRGEADGLRSFVRSERDVEQHAGRFVAHLGVGILADDLSEHGDGPELADRSPADAGIRIGAREGCEQVLLVFGQFLDARHPDERVGVLPAGLRLESVEKTHAECPGVTAGRFVSTARPPVGQYSLQDGANPRLPVPHGRVIVRRVDGRPATGTGGWER